MYFYVVGGHGVISGFVTLVMRALVSNVFMGCSHSDITFSGASSFLRGGLFFFAIKKGKTRQLCANVLYVCVCVCACIRFLCRREVVLISDINVESMV